MDYKVLLMAAMAVLLLAVVGSCRPPARSIPPPTPAEVSYSERVLEVYSRLPKGRYYAPMLQEAQRIVDKEIELQKRCE